AEVPVGELTRAPQEAGAAPSLPAGAEARLGLGRLLDGEAFLWTLRWRCVCGIRAGCLIHAPLTLPARLPRVARCPGPRLPHPRGHRGRRETLRRGPPRD